MPGYVEDFLVVNAGLFMERLGISYCLVDTTRASVLSPTQGRSWRSSTSVE